MKPKLFVIDGSALLYRYYHAYKNSPYTAEDGSNVNAVYGIGLAVAQLLKDHRPDYIAFVLDNYEMKTFRHKIYSEYKSNRNGLPEDLAPQSKKVIRLLEDGFGIKVFSIPGVEGDDVVGTLAVVGEKCNLDVFMVTADKDMFQLLTPNIRVYSVRPGSDALLYDLNYLKREYKMTPQQFLEYLALRGDAVDGVPGIKGIGDVRARQLIHKFGSLKKLYRNLVLVGSRKIRGWLREGKEDLRMCYRLVKIRTDVPLQFKWEDLKRRPVDMMKLWPIVKEYGIGNLTHYISVNQQVNGEKPTGTDIPF